MKININHLGYVVYIKERSKFVGDNTSVAIAQQDTKDQSTIFIELPIRKINLSILAHEITHVLQYICESRGIDFKEEKEHMAYIMQYIFNEVCGYKYKMDLSTT